MSPDCNEYWYLARAMRPPVKSRFCTGIRMVRMPGIVAVAVRRRFITTSIELRLSLSFRRMNRKPRFVAPPKPTAEVTETTAGSPSISWLTAICRADISRKLVSAWASVTPRRKPVSSSGKKPLGMPI